MPFRPEAGRPPHDAANFRHPETLRVLLESAGDANARTPAGDTPMHLACAANSPECVAILLDHGGDREARNAAKLRPLDVAARTGRRAAADALSAEPPTALNRRLIKAVRNRDEAGVRSALAAGGDPDAKTFAQDGSLHLASQNGDIRIVRMLIDAGGAVNMRDATLRTPLHRAAANRHPGTAQALLGEGADVHALDSALTSPLGTAAHHGCLETAAILIKAGASLRNAVVLAETAARCGHVELAEMLAAAAKGVEQERRPIRAAEAEATASL